MKNTLYPFYVIVLVLLSGILKGQGLMNSHHDFSGATWSGNEYCKPCHTPHNANMDVNNSPLWNHQVTSATFNIYSSNTLDANPGQPTGKSKLCLSCHDGTVAIDNHSGNTSGTIFAGFGSLSTDLGDEHPISINYDAALVAQDGELNDPTVTASGLGGTISEDLLENGKLECTSCHDVHLSRNSQGCIGCHDMHNGTTTTLSLWKSNNGSALCLTCHKK